MSSSSLAQCVGVDGGQSQLRLRIAGTNQTVVVPGVGHGDSVAGRIRSSIAEAGQAAQVGPGARLVAGLTAVPAEPGAVASLSADLARDLKADQVWIFDDTVTAHSGAFGGESGIVLVVGTGVACLAVDADAGLIHRTSGAGFLIGDEGGAFWIGRTALAEAIKAFDGRGPQTALLGAAVAHFNCQPDGLADHIHNSERSVSFIAEFAVDVLEAAEAGDQLAHSVLVEAAAELAQCVKACVDTLPGCRVGGVALMGRLLTESNFFTALVSSTINKADPMVHVFSTDQTPLDGAIALAQTGDLGIYRQALLASATAADPSARVPGSTAAAYFRAAEVTLGDAATSEQDAVATAAELIAERLIAGGMIHAFGSGHSHMLAEELFYRAGGLARVDPILVDDLMLHVSASESSQIERRPGLARKLLASHPMHPNDVLIVASNSGGNTVSIELAAIAKELGVLVVAVTSLTHARSSQARATDGPRLHDLADVVLDNHGAVGDAALHIVGIDRRVGATSTVVGAALLQALAAEVVACMIDRGVEPEVFASSNTSGGDEINRVLLERYRGQVKAL